MVLSKKIALARKKKGLTQEQLAELANVTVRTIQRIENGENTPRAFTLKTLAEALDTSYEDLTAEEDNQSHLSAATIPDDHLLKTICLSCFSYLIIPLIHFLIPAYLLRKSGTSDPATRTLAQKIIRQQMGWVAVTSAVMLLALAYNLIVVANDQRAYVLNFLWPFFIMYLLNAVLLMVNWRQIKKLTPKQPQP